MSFDDYFDLDDSMDRLDQTIAFLTGLCPEATHVPYMDMSQVDPKTGRGPSAGLACHLCSGVVAAEVTKILLKRGPTEPVPCYAQFDAYQRELRTGRLPSGNRDPSRRQLRQQLREQFIQMGWSSPPGG
jgi:hypothetical protein